jgi:hypothetical protein
MRAERAAADRIEAAIGAVDVDAKVGPRGGGVGVAGAARVAEVVVERAGQGGRVGNRRRRDQHVEGHVLAQAVGTRIERRQRKVGGALRVLRGGVALTQLVCARAKAWVREAARRGCLCCQAGRRASRKRARTVLAKVAARIGC